MRASLIAAAWLALAGCAHSTPEVREPGPPHPLIETVSEQEILTPVPVRVSLPATLGVETIAVRFRTRGTDQWTTRELFRSGQTWRGEVPCLEVSTITGELQYYLLARDERGKLIATSGTHSWPHTTLISHRLPDGPRGLPDAPLPWRCPDPADCPPDFPGCPEQALSRAPCSRHDDCGDRRCAWDGYCEAPD